MKKIYSFSRLFALLTLLFVGLGSAWAQEPDWSVTTFSGTISSNSLTINNATLSFGDFTVGSNANGEPTVTISGGKLKFGNSKNQFWSSYSISTDAFNDKNITKVEVGCYDNGATESTITATQGSVQIGTATVNQTSNPKDITLNTTSGAGGTLKLTYSSTKQASYISYIKVYYATSGDPDPDPEPEPEPTPAPSSYTYVQTNLSDITSTDEVLVVWTKDGNSYAMSNDNGTSDAPTAVSVTIANNIITTSANNISWKLTKTDETFVLNPYGVDSKWLYCTNTNNGVRVGTGAAKDFQISDNYLYEKGTTDARYLGVYSGQDVRCYTSINSNITGQTLSFFVKRAIVTVGAAGYATFASATDFIVNGNDAVYYASAVTHDAITFTAIETGTSVKAGEGLLIKGEGTHTFLPTTGATTIAGNELHGVLVATDLSTVEGAYVLAVQDNGETAFCPVSGGSLAAGKAYLVRPNALAGAPQAMRIVFETEETETATGIENIEAEQAVKFIENGQLIIIKNGVRYNALGQVVR